MKRFSTIATERLDSGMTCIYTSETVVADCVESAIIFANNRASYRGMCVPRNAEWTAWEIKDKPKEDEK